MDEEYTHIVMKNDNSGLLAGWGKKQYSVTRPVTTTTTTYLHPACSSTSYGLQGRRVDLVLGAVMDNSNEGKINK